ncbi:DNA repair protein RecO [compost metagenome]
MDEGKDPGIVLNLYEMKILQAAGYGPQLNTCVSCGQERMDDDLLVSPRMGGVLCRHCRHLDPPAMNVSPRGLKMLRLFEQIDLRQLGNIKVTEETKAELKQIMRAFIDMQLGVNLKSRNFLDQMEKYEI